MLFFTKKKPILKDLIPDNYIDIHSHLLPGIDDGAKNFEDTLHLVESLQNIGFSQLITTPHIIKQVWENNAEIINKTKKETIIKLKESNITIPLRAAAEYLMDDQFEDLVKNKELLTLKDNYVLVEMSYMNAPIQLYNILFDIQVAGYTPILAHPERYLFYHNNFDEYSKLKKAGCLFQLNLLSTTGYYGKNVAKIAEKLLKKGLYNYVGSDVHHKNHLATFDKRIIIDDSDELNEIIKNNEFFRF